MLWVFPLADDPRNACPFTFRFQSKKGLEDVGLLETGVTKLMERREGLFPCILFPLISDSGSRPIVAGGSQSSSSLERKLLRQFSWIQSGMQSSVLDHLFRVSIHVRVAGTCGQGAKSILWPTVGRIVFCFHRHRMNDLWRCVSTSKDETMVCGCKRLWSWPTYLVDHLYVALKGKRCVTKLSARKMIGPHISQKNCIGL